VPSAKKLDPLPYRQPMLEESARVLPQDLNPPRFSIICRHDFTEVHTRTILVKFRGRDVTVKRASEVRLFSALGISLLGPDIKFQLESGGGFRHLVTPESSNFFGYGDAVFFVDHETHMLKVWAKWFWYEFPRGYFGFGLPEPVPEVIQPLKALPAIRQP
jgi:hypothetical protein